MKIGFIGAGNMGGAILKGYAPKAEQEGTQVLVFDPKEGVTEALSREFEPVVAYDSMERVINDSNILFLGVKPNLFEDILPVVSSLYTDDKVVVSMAAGVTMEFVENYLGQTAKVVRIMPNTPALVKEAMTAVCRNDNVDDYSFDRVSEILQSIGRAEEVEEDLFHCVIGASGSSPAYTYMYIEALMKGAVDNGMSQDQARVFAAQSVLGAAKMVLEGDVSPEQLRINVCSPGGTTIEAVNKLFENDFQGNVAEGFQAAVDKSKDMTK